MTNRQIKAVTLAALANATIERNSDKIAKLLFKVAGQSKFSIPKQTYDKLMELTEGFDWSKLKYVGVYNPQQIKRFVIAACYIIKCFYYNYTSITRKDSEILDEGIIDAMEGCMKNWLNLSYFPIKNHFNSARNSDAPGNVIDFLIANEIIVLKHRAFKIPNGAGRCAKYELTDKFFEIYDGKRGNLVLDLPKTYINSITKKIKEIAQFPQELYMMAYSLFLKPSEKDIKLASNRIKKQQSIKRKIRSGEELEKVTKELNRSCGMELSVAVLLMRIYNADSAILMMCSNDKYAGRFYHAWTSIPSEIRERAEISEELKGFFHNSNLVEVDLSQSCMYFIFIQYLKYCGKNGIQPKKQLVKAVYAGKLREYICLNAIGKCGVPIGNGEYQEVDFDEIKTITDYNKNKDILKKFCMYGLNCGTTAIGGQIFDRALASIDRNFMNFIIEERKGWWNDASTKSTIPFKTLANEVEYMLGIKAWHILPDDNKKLSETEVVLSKSPYKSVTEILIKKGCKFFLTIHDAIIVTEEDLPLVYDALNEAANIRQHLFAPCAKTTFFKTGIVKKNCYKHGNRRPDIGDEDEKYATTYPFNIWVERNFKDEQLFYIENTMDEQYYKDLLVVRRKMKNIIKKQLTA